MGSRSTQDGWPDVEARTGGKQRRAALRGVGCEQPAAVPLPEPRTGVELRADEAGGFFPCARDELHPASCERR